MALTKHQLIQNDIRAKISRGDLAPGAPLPSQQELMAAYGVAQGTVRQALDRLQADGIVVAQRGKGTYVNQITAPSKSTAVTTLGIIAIGPKERFTIIHDAFPLVQEAAARHNYELAIHFFTTDQEEEMVQWSRKHAGVLIWSAAKLRLVDKLLALGIPTAVLGELYDAPCPVGASWIHFNVDDTASLAIQVLKAMGHTRIWFVSRVGTYYYDWFARAFAEETKAAGIADTAKFVPIALIEDEPQLLSMLEAAQEKPTAILVEGDIRACRLIHILEKGKWHIPDRLSVMAIGASDHDRLGVRDLYRVITPPDVAVQRSIEALAESIRTGRVVRHVISPRLLPGKTCIPLKP